MMEKEIATTDTTISSANRRRFLAKALGVLAGTSLIGGVAKAFAQIGQKTIASNGGQKQVAGTDAYLGEIMMFAGNFAPTGWAYCDGSLLLISSNEALFSLLGTNYGGDGVTHFALPDFRGRVPVGYGSGPGLSSYAVGQSGGEEKHTLQTGEMPSHNHAAYADVSDGTSATPSNNLPAVNSEGIEHYGSTQNGSMNANAIGATGGSQPHNNIQPYLTVSFCIATAGIYPSRS
jgi:microcystin-dependent protein